MYLHGQKRIASDYLAALDQANQLRRQIGPLFERYDMLLAPSTSQTAKAHATIDPNQDLGAKAFTRLRYHSEVFRPFANTTRQPDISLPLFQARDGNCISVHLMGRFGEDATLLQVSAELERALPWLQRRPPVHLSI
ncbi:amidase family protein [Roseateles sp.]|uniref:amidase family protein n=1 Tax=Roseateles sp. TaxID=1971397 RepID=UPI003D0BA600